MFNEYPILGIDENIMTTTVHNYANARLKAIGLDPIFPEGKETYLQKLVNKHLDSNTTRTNFFEGNVTNYSKASIDIDDF
jgi:ribonucleoside-diphosphate reductase beta chain